MAVRKRSVTIAGHATSFSLEDEFWDALKQLAHRDQMSVAALIRHIDETRSRDSNLSSAIRVFVLRAARAGDLPDAGAQSTGSPSAKA